MNVFEGPLYMVRNDGICIKNGRTKDKELQFMIKIIGDFLPLVVRLYTKTKIFAGLVTKLKSHNGTVEFVIIDCHANGTSGEKAKTYVKKISLEELIEIEPVRLSIYVLWALYLKRRREKKR